MSVLSTSMLTPTRERPGAHRARRRLRGAAWAAGIVLGLVATSTQSAAFWSASTTPGSAGGASATTVLQAAAPQVTVLNRRDMRLEWNAATLADGTPATGYVVTRYSQAGTASAATGGCSGTVTAPTCTETAVPDGLWTYRVTARYRSWSGPPSAASAAARADVTPPSNDIDRQAVSGGSVRVGASTYYYRGLAAGSLRLVNALTDTGGSGPAQSVTGAVSAAGWTHQASSVSTPAGGPYVSNLFSWAAGTTSEFDLGVSGIDAYGNTAPATLAFRLDNAPPTGGAISYRDGSQSSTTVQVSVGAVADARAGVASRVLEYASATATGSSCGAFGTWTVATQNPGSTVSLTATTGRCYRFRYVVVDAVGNQLVSTSSDVVRIQSYQSVIQGAPGLTGYWRLNDATTSNTIAATNGNPGTWSGGPTRQEAGAIASDSDRSVYFDGVNDFGRVARPVANSFSLEFWFRSNQGLGTGNNWYDGAGMVDAEVSGLANDFGVSLLANGRVAAGVGNPDRTALSATGFNNNAWHHVVMTRNQGTGLVELYVDGVRRATVTGGTQALSASANLDFGRLQTGLNYYRGHLDEIAVYSGVLPEATVLDHYRSGSP